MHNPYFTKKNPHRTWKEIMINILYAIAIPFLWLGILVLKTVDNILFSPNKTTINNGGTYYGKSYCSSEMNRKTQGGTTLDKG